MLLALDTATDNASIALHDGGQVLAELSWRSWRRHTVELAPQVDALLRLARAAPGDLTAVAVSIGPGSYVGTRVALSFAKGVIAALGLPLLGIPSLDVLAYPHLHPTLPSHHPDRGGARALQLGQLRPWRPRAPPPAPVGP